MTKEQIHEALCKAPDEDKMRLAIACQMNGIDVRDIETGLANVLTGVQKAIKPAIEYYRSIMQRALLSIRKKCHTTGTRVSFAIYAIILMEKVPKIWKERNAMNM